MQRRRLGHLVCCVPRRNLQATFSQIRKKGLISYEMVNDGAGIVGSSAQLIQKRLDYGNDRYDDFLFSR
jgi:hypothetical protein